MKDTSLSKPFLLADENIPLGVVDLLINKGFDIKRVKLGLGDMQVFELARLEKRVLLTLDKHFLNKLKFPSRDSFGIVFLKVHPPKIDTIDFLLSKLFGRITALEFKGKLFIVSLSGFKIWPKDSER